MLPSGRTTRIGSVDVTKPTTAQEELGSINSKKAEKMGLKIAGNRMSDLLHQRLSEVNEFLAIKDGSRLREPQTRLS